MIVGRPLRAERQVASADSEIPSRIGTRWSWSSLTSWVGFDARVRCGVWTGAADRRPGEVARGTVIARGPPGRPDSAQIGWAIGQRVWKRQPDGGSIGLGMSPLSTIRLLLRPGTGSGIGREQRHRVRVQRPGEQLVRGRDLDDPAEVHHRDAIRDVADDGEIVGDEDVGEVELLLQVDEQVEHLRLDRDVERGDRLVRDDELRLQHERAGEPDALPLAAAELVRVPAGRLGRHADALHRSTSFATASVRSGAAPSTQ